MSASGGNTVFPLLFSRCRNRLSSRNPSDKISSFRCASQLSCSVSISSFSSSFCSGVSFSTHLALSNFGVATGAAGGAPPPAFEPVPLLVAFGASKKDVIFPFAFGFLVSLAARSAALRLSDIVNVGRQIRRKSLEDSLADLEGKWGIESKLRRDF